jgi:hypothetical protein
MSTCNRVHLMAYAPNGSQVLEVVLTVEDYYQNSHPLLDEVTFRGNHGVVRLCGTIYDAQGIMNEEFEVRYDQRGAYICDAVRFADGRSLGDWIKVKAPRT